MAKKSSIQNIDLETQINLDTLQSKTTQFDGFNDCNSTLYNSSLSPFFIQEKSKLVTEKLFVDKQGNEYLLDQSTGQLTRNGALVYNFTNEGLIKKEIPFETTVLNYFEENGIVGRLVNNFLNSFTCEYDSLTQNITLPEGYILVKSNIVFNGTDIIYVIYGSNVSINSGVMVASVYKNGIFNSSPEIYYELTQTDTQEDYAITTLDNNILFYRNSALFVYEFGGLGWATISEFTVDQVGNFILPTRLIQDGKLYISLDNLLINDNRVKIYSTIPKTLTKNTKTVPSPTPELVYENPTGVTVDYHVVAFLGASGQPITTSTVSVASFSGGFPIEGLEGSCLNGKTILEEIFLPSSIRFIGPNAFSSCSNLKSVYIGGNTLDTIESDAFKNCSKLDRINLPDSLTTIEEGAFEGCTSLKTVYTNYTKGNYPAGWNTTDNDILFNATWVPYTDPYTTYTLESSINDDENFGIKNMYRQSGSLTGFKYESTVQSNGFHYRINASIGSGNQAYIVLDNNWYDVKTVCGVAIDEVSNNITTNAYGSRFHRNGFNVIYKNGFPAAVSYSKNIRESGTLLSEWYSLEDSYLPVITGNTITYKDVTSKNFVIISKQNSLDSFILDDRYIVVSTTDYLNAYDIQNNVLLHYASDYNNFLVPTAGYTTYTVSGVKCANMNPSSFPFTSGAAVTSARVASYINPSPENTLVPFLSLQNNASLVSYVTKSYYEKYYNLGVSFVNQVEKVDYYFTDDTQAINPSYVQSFYSDDRYTSIVNSFDIRLESFVAPSVSGGNELRNIDIFSRIIKSYVNSDIVFSGSTGAPLVYNTNLQELFAYYSQSRIEFLTAIFVLQGQTFAVINDLLYAVSFSGGLIVGQTPIVDVSGFTFMGSNTQVAVFHSRANKSIYQFTGDRVLQKTWSAAAIDEIKQSWYNPSTYTITFSTDEGIIFFSQTNMFRIKESQNINDFIYADDVFYLEFEDKYVAYSQVPRDGFISQPVDLKTRYYGAGDNIVSVIDTWYLRLYSKDRLPGDIKLNVSTITDTTTIAEEKTFKIREKDWDINNCYYLRYQPKLQRSIGTQLGIVSPFSIYELSCGVSSEGTTQVSKGNI